MIVGLIIYLALLRNTTHGFFMFTNPKLAVGQPNSRSKKVELSEVVNFCARKMVYRTYFISLCKKINLLQDLVINFSLKNVSCMGRGISKSHEKYVLRT